MAPLGDPNRHFYLDIYLSSSRPKRSYRYLVAISPFKTASVSTRPKIFSSPNPVLAGARGVFASVIGGRRPNRVKRGPEGRYRNRFLNEYVGANVFSIHKTRNGETTGASGCSEITGNHALRRFLR
jgi:hypothetical protein